MMTQIIAATATTTAALAQADSVACARMQALGRAVRFFTGLAVLLTAGLATSTDARAQTAGMQSDWIEFVKGHREARMGAEVREVTEDPETGTTTLVVAIPKGSMGEPHTEMEEVTVIGKAPEKIEFKPLFPDIQTEWVDDYDNDFYGLLVRLNGDQKVPFRLFFSAHGQGGAIENHPQQP